MKWLRAIRHVGREVRDYFASEHVRAFPFVTPLRTYDRTKLRADLRASLGVTMLGVPQSIAYASIANLPIVYGIICCAVACAVAPLFSGSRHTIIGPTNASALMLFSFSSMHPEMNGRWGDLLPLLVMMSGLFAVLGAVFRIADLLQYVSRSVLVGYISGAAVLIIANQTKPWLGLGGLIDPQAASTFLGLLVELVKALPHAGLGPFLIGAATIALFFGLKRFRPKWPVFAITLVVSSAVFGPLVRAEIGPFAGVSTYTTFSFSDLMPNMPNLLRTGVFSDIAELLGVAIALAFLSSLETTLMSKTISSRSGDRPDPNQDMYSVGMANVATALAGGMPASGSPNRSMLNFESGARTRFAALFAGVFTLGLALLIAASVGWGLPLIDFLPKPALAGLVIAVSLSLFNPRQIRICMRSTGDDAAVLLITFLSTLLAPLYVAIFIGVAVSVSLFLRRASKPHLVEYEFNDEGELREKGEKRERPIPAISIVHVEGDLFFGAAELFRTQIQRTVSDPAIRVIILRLKNARHLDATSVMALEDLIKFMRAKGLHLIVSGAPREVYRVLKESGVLQTLQEGCRREEGETNLFIGNPHNPNLSTRDALLRAQELLGTKKADIRIFYDPRHSKSESS
ncbi:MAG: SulP family inorganic anion transporter [Akkermansiaceae bacterium]|nr:SulP family inorganic anion transporter [Akkermansiaceae bacterium]